ncbi:hypothetical protein L2E82_52114 [Cichorium intybus]|nr:hypothetical protein L2E82_52114 [Cichorium intybus]
MCKCRSHGTFPLFGLQSSHLNICYYHQDPHRRPLRPGSRPRFCSDRRALLLIGAWHLPRRPGVGRALKRHPFSGLVDSAVGTVTRLPVHPASPVLLTKNGPLGALDSVARLNEAANSHPGSSYPEGNFGGNQLLDGSISLSPLYPSQTNDLHVSIAAGLHQSFLCFAPLRHSSPSFGSPTGMLTLEPFSEDQGRSAVHPARGIPPISFLAPCGFTHPLTRTHVRLLGPCFKTGRMGCPQPVPGARRYIAETGACCQPRSTRRHLHELSTARALAAAPIRTGPRPESIGGPAIAVPHPTGTHRRPPFASLPTISSTL